MVKDQSDDFLLLSGDGIFFSLQGEGLRIGVPAIFIRLHMCNLKCDFKGGSKCDAWYTWDKSSTEYYSESRKYSYQEIYDELRKYNCKFVVITGGEPLLQQKKILGFMNYLYEMREDNYTFEIETNGTVVPDDRFMLLGYV